MMSIILALEFLKCLRRCLLSGERAPTVRRRFRKSTSNLMEAPEGTAERTMRLLTARMCCCFRRCSFGGTASESQLPLRKSVKSFAGRDRQASGA